MQYVNTFLDYFSNFFNSVAFVIYDILSFNPLVSVAVFSVLILFLIGGYFFYFSKY